MDKQKEKEMLKEGERERENKVNKQNKQTQKESNK